MKIFFTHLFDADLHRRSGQFSLQVLGQVGARAFLVHCRIATSVLCVCVCVCVLCCVFVCMIYKIHFSLCELLKNSVIINYYFDNDYKI